MTNLEKLKEIESRLKAISDREEVPHHRSELFLRALLEHEQSGIENIDEAYERAVNSTVEYMQYAIKSIRFFEVEIAQLFNQESGSSGLAEVLVDALNGVSEALELPTFECKLHDLMEEESAKMRIKHINLLARKRLAMSAVLKYLHFVLIPPLLSHYRSLDRKEST